MSILIKNVEMPVSCAGCPCANDESRYCYAAKKYIPMLGKPDFCPLAEVEERKTGKWIKNSNGTYSCDKCHSWIPNEQHYYANFCLYCGADMRGEQDGKNT